MEGNKFLYQWLENELGKRNIKNILLPNIIIQNLNPKFFLREYQKEAFQYFINYWQEKFEGKSNQHQLLFLMATSSGKTLIMAGLILYLYIQGYRNFLFFVNSTNIIDKTRDNFLNDVSIKYLFNKSLAYGEKKITLQAVDNFQNTDNDNINICFETIQGLHSRLNTPRENSLTYDDFQDKKIVLISDEAHHINVETKASSQLSKEEKEELNSWENTVNKIFVANSQNILLEFTATIDFNNANIVNKYAPRLIFNYQLKQFRIDGYSKEIEVLQTDAKLFDRALQAVLLSQYRYKLFEKNGQIIKPVILFKSKTINGSKEFQEEFISGINALTSDKLKEIKVNTKDEFLTKIFKYLAINNISLENFVLELKEVFATEKTLVVNSKEESVEKQLAVNTLEDPNNEYRAIFAVDKLNEGWDVLNLFDIVRLYDTRDSKNNLPGSTTIKEAQLIGRGARYCPFKINDNDDPCQRKFDHDLQNEMRICEQLYYHSTYNPKYIQELKSALRETGIIPDNTVKRKLTIKKEFKDSEFYNSACIYLNRQEKYSRNEVIELPSAIRNFPYRESLRTGISLSRNLFEESVKENIEPKEKIFQIHKDFESRIVKKALYQFDFYSFSNLKKWFPNVETLTDFIIKEEYLGGIKITVTGLTSQLQKLNPNNQFEVLVKIIEQITSSLTSSNREFRGSKEFTSSWLKQLISDKELNFVLNESGDKELGKSMNDIQETRIHLNLNNRNWYIFTDCFGTFEEKYFVKYINKIYDKLCEKYEEIYLIRNERFFKLYNFEDGGPFEPDYVLFLKQKSSSKKSYYQIFIEPKGKYLKEQDRWKEKFLIFLKEQKMEKLWEDKKYIILGMPFYSHNKENIFANELEKELF